MSLTAHFRALFRRRGGALPEPPPFAPDEVRALLSPGWNGPVVETSVNFPRRDRSPYLKPPTA